MVLGVGISSFYQTWQNGEPYPLEIAPPIIISSIGLIVVLSSTLIVVNLNGYNMTKNLGYWMVAVYLACLFINLILEFFFL
jgi:sodium/potassium/calcium exchanger 6